MFRYLAIATVLVLGAIALILAVPRGRDVPGGSVKFSSSTASPGPGQNEDRSAATPVSVRGEAPWALSSLPECFQQLSRRDGNAAFARRGIPTHARLLPSGFRLGVADCTLVIRGDTVDVTRGDDRLTIPPHARLFEYAGTLVLDRTDAFAEDVRTYRVSRGTGFAPETPPPATGSRPTRRPTSL